LDFTFLRNPVLLYLDSEAVLCCGCVRLECYI